MMSIYLPDDSNGGEGKKSLTAGVSSVTFPPMQQRSVIAVVGGAASVVGFGHGIISPVLQITSAEKYVAATALQRCSSDVFLT
jgi:hypothetical protein